MLSRLPTFLLIILFIALNFTVFIPAKAQTTPLPPGIEEQLSIVLSPTIPQPNELVSITVSSFSTNINNARIVWRENGVSKLSGVGEKTFSFTAPPAGKVSNIAVSVFKENGGVVSETITIAPANVDLVYEARTYTPPFYKGGAVFTKQAKAKVVAIPNFIRTGGGKVPDANMVYKWKINGKVNQQQSGVGKNVLEIEGEIIPKTIKVEVEVSATNSPLKSRGSLEIKPEDPRVLLYENNPVHGLIFEQALLGSFTLNRPEIEISTIPYFFSSEKRFNTKLNHEWTINNKKAPIVSETSDIVLRKEEDQNGFSTISLNLRHFDKILQYSKTGLIIELEDNQDQNAKDFTF